MSYLLVLLPRLLAPIVASGKSPAVSVWVILGFLERFGGEPVPLLEDGMSVSALNVTIIMTALGSGYASAIAARVREAAVRIPQEPTETRRASTPPTSSTDLIRGYRRAGRKRPPDA